MPMPITIGIGIVGLALILYSIRKRRRVTMTNDNDHPNIIKDSKFKAKIKRGEKATILDIKSPTITDNVEASLEAEDVKDAAVVRTNQTLNITMSKCANCHRPLPSVAFGVKPSNVKCRVCGHINKMGENE